MMIDGSTFRILGIPGVLLINNSRENLIFLSLFINKMPRNIHAEMASSGLVPVLQTESAQADDGTDEINHRNDDSGYDDPHEHDDK